VRVKQRQSAVPEAVVDLAKRLWQAKPRVTPQALLPGNCRTEVMLLVPQPAQRLHLEPQDLLLPQGREILPSRVRAPQYLQGPGPFAFFRETRDAEKCNLAARCADLPIFGRYHWRCNRRGFVGYGNRRNRLLHTRARRAGTFPIVGADKCPSLLRLIED
jgi:hypothetical protein